MSLTATLIAFAAGIAAKVKLPPSKKEGVTDPRWRNVVERLDRDLAVQKTLVEHWKGEARTFVRRIAELEAERDAARNQRDALDAELARQWHRNDHQHAQQQHGAMLAQQANMQSMLAQYNAQAQAQAQGFQQLGAQNLFGHGLLGAQNLEMPAGWTCTCIPDRASALRHR
jgi:chromosome segregation ATPase